MPESIDLRMSTQWAIASLESVGAVGVTRTVFDLVNRQTGRAHRMELFSGGLGIGLPFSGSFTSSGYAYFETPRPVNFNDFDGNGARLTSASVVLYSVSYLTIWEGPAYGSPRLAKVTIDGGWGLSTPGAEFGHGVTNVIFGAGDPAGDVWLAPATPDFHDAPEPVRLHVTSVTHEEVDFELVGDALFDFDKADIKPESARLLEYAGKVIRSRPGHVNIIGYTDSKGTAAYNQALSERRAAAVKAWLVGHKYVRAANVEAFGHGSQYPVAPNTKPDGSDDPAGRAKNRRIEIVITKR
jgi:outer membrane protein OmpA-like peptidoglycan-associated protein